MAIKFLSGLNLSNVTAGSILKLDSNGNIVAAVDGTDYNTGSADSWSTVSSDIYRNSDVRIGTYQTSLAPSARLHVFDYQTTDPKLLIEDGNTGDASMQFKISTQQYTMGIDNSDSDKFIIANAGGFGLAANTHALEISTTGKVTIPAHTTQGAVRFEVASYNRLRVHGVDLLAYNGDHLWVIGNSTTNTINLGGSWDWDQQVAISYTPGTTGDAAGRMILGQTEKNNTNWTHGITSFYTNGDERIRINSAGNVGIGTTDPDSRVHIEASTDGTGSGADAVLHVKQNGGWNANQPWALYVEGYSYLNGFRINAADGIRALHKVASGGQLGFSVTDTAPITFTQSNSTERMRVHTNGYIGIGTASPEEKLHVIGNIKQNDYIIGRGAEHKVATMPDYYKIAQVTIDGTYGTSHRIEGTVSYGGDNEKSTKIEFWISFRSGGNLNVGTPLVRYGYRVENLNVASSNGFESGSVDTAFRVSKTSDTSGGNKVYEIQFSPNDSNYISAQWEVKYSDYGNQGSYPTTVYSTLQSYGTDISDANILKSQDSTRVDNNTWITQLGVGSSNNTSFSFYNNNTSYFNGSVTIDANLSMTGGGYITTDSSNALTLRSDVQHGQGDTDAVISFKQSTSELGKFDQDGYLYAAGFKTSGTTGFLKSDGTVATGSFFSGAYNDLSGKPTLGTMAAAATSDYKTSDATETYVGLELASYTLTSALGTAATTASTDYATAAQGTTADAALPKAAGSGNKLTDALYIQGTNTTNAESVLLRGISSNDGDWLGSIRTANIGAYNQEMRFYTSNANGTSDEDLTLTLHPTQNATFASNVYAGGDLTVAGGDVTVSNQNDAPTFTLLHDGTNPSTNDLLFKMQFQSDYDGSHQNWGKIVLETNSSAVRTDMDFYVKSASGNEQLGLRIQGGASTPKAYFFNDVDVDGDLTATNLSGTNTGDQTLPTLSSLGALSTTAAASTYLPLSGGTLYKSTSSSGTTGTTFLTVQNYVGGDIGQQQSFIDFMFTDSNANFTPQVRIGAQVGRDADADAISKEGAGAFVVYTGDGTNETGSGSLTESFRVSYNGGVTTGGKLYIGSTDATSTATTALLLGAAGEVKKRGLGSNAFSSTSFLPLAGGTVTGMTIFEDGMRIGTGNHQTNGRASITFGEGTTTGDNMYIEYDGENLNGDNNAIIFGSAQEGVGDIFRVTYGGAVLIGTNQVATESYVTTAVSDLIDSSPAALNTLNELAAALGDDASFSTTMSTALGNRLRIDVNNQSLSSTELANARTNLGLGTAATAASTDFVAVSGDTMTGALVINEGASDQTNSSDTTTLPSTTGAEFMRINGVYTDGRYATEFTKVDRGGNLPLYIRQSKGTANSFVNLARFGDHTNSVHEFEVFGSIKATGGDSGNWNTAYTYSQVGHLPLAGGTLSGALTVTNASQGVLVDSEGHASIRVDRGSTSYDNNLLFYTAGSLKWRLWQDGSDDYLYLRDEVTSGNMVVFKRGGNVGIGASDPAAPLDVQPASDYKVTKVGDDRTSHYKFTGAVDHTLTLASGSYYSAEVVITAHQTNGGTNNNLYIRGIWTNNHTSHHWHEIENIGGLSGSSFTITNGQSGDTTNSGELEIVHDYSSGSFGQMVVRVTDHYGTHSYTIS